MGNENLGGKLEYELKTEFREAVVIPYRVISHYGSIHHTAPARVLLIRDVISDTRKYHKRWYLYNGCWGIVSIYSSRRTLLNRKEIKGKHNIHMGVKGSQFCEDSKDNIS
jgi:hypothetical protein